jgi:ABC-type Fe3+ transport system substrate-binding protein
MVLSGRPSTLGNFTGILVLTKGEDFVRKLGKQDIPVYNMGGRALSNMVVSGEVALSPEVYNSHMQNSKRKGASVDWRALGPVFGNIGASVLPKKPPHPHAAMLFIDFMLSKDGQKMMQTLGYVSPRVDLVSRGRPKELIDLYSRPNYPTEIEQWLRLAKQSFGKLKANPHPKKKKKKKK